MEAGQLYSRAPFALTICGVGRGNIANPKKIGSSDILPASIRLKLIEKAAPAAGPDKLYSAFIEQQLNGTPALYGAAVPINRRIA
jgi:hypothetical protein